MIKAYQFIKLCKEEKNLKDHKLSSLFLISVGLFFIIFFLYAAVTQTQDSDTLDIPILISLTDLGYKESYVSEVKLGTFNRNNKFYQLILMDTPVSNKDTAVLTIYLYETENPSEIDKLLERYMVEYENVMDRLDSDCNESCIMIVDPNREKYENIKSYMLDQSALWDADQAYTDPNDNIFFKKDFIVEGNRLLTLQYANENFNFNAEDRVQLKKLLTMPFPEKMN